MNEPDITLAVTETSSIRLLIIEDEPDLREAMSTYLRLEGMQVHCAGSLNEAEQSMKNHDFDILLLDLGLPDGDGIDWLTQQPHLRSKGIIIISARGQPMSRISGARAGADLYLVKPVEMEELAIVVTNLARRLSTPIQNDAWTVDHTQWLLTIPDRRQIKLTRSETLILAELARSNDNSVSREKLIESLGYDPKIYDLRRMEILIRRLRNKVLDETGCMLPLETLHRFGYGFSARLNLIR